MLTGIYCLPTELVPLLRDIRSIMEFLFLKNIICSCILINDTSFIIISLVFCSVNDKTLFLPKIFCIIGIS